MTLSGLLATLVLTTASVTQATLTAAGRALKEEAAQKEQGHVVSVALSAREGSFDNLKDLRSSGGPKTLAALKLAMRKIPNLPLPSSLLSLKLDKEGLHSFAEQSFVALLDASQSQWLLGPQEASNLATRYRTKVFNDMTEDLKTDSTVPPRELLERHWGKAYDAFFRALFEEEKQLRKSWNLLMEDTEEELGVGEPGDYPNSSTPVGPVGVYSAFEVLTGLCQVDSEGCVTSPNFPQNYSNRGACIISVDSNRTGPLRVTNFSTEPLADTLTINGIVYTGKVGPQGVWPQEDIVWYSDYVSEAEGWRFCPSEPFPPDHKHETLHPKTVLTVVRGNCTVGKLGCAMSTNYPANYPNRDYCVINVSAGGQSPLHVERFHTESLYDYMTVNSEKYSGVLGPEGIVPTGPITWQSDYTYGASGWKICPREPSPDLGVTNNSVFTVRVGNCKVLGDGCVQSPGFPNLYTDASVCTIGVNTDVAGPLRVVTFDTEVNYDALQVNGMRFTGTHGPEGLVPYEDILWYADFEAARQGWKICADPKPEAPEPQPDPVITLVEGNCLVHANCATSPWYPRRYPNDGHCILSVTANNTYPLRVLDFVTENQLDTLTVNGVAYSGIAGPDAVVPQGKIEWVSDGAVRGGGWHICLAPPPRPAPTTTTLPMSTVPVTTPPPKSTTTIPIIPGTGGTVAPTPSPSQWPETFNPWDDLAYHMEVSKVLTESMLSVESSTRLFRKISSLRWKGMSGDVFNLEQGAAAFAPEEVYMDLNWTSTQIASSVLEPWLYVQASLVNATDNLMRTLRPAGGLWLETLNGTTHEVETMHFKTINHFVDIMTTLDSIKMSESAAMRDVLVNSLAENTQVFRRVLNSFLEDTFTRINAVPRFLKDEVDAPMIYVGQGYPRDTSGMEYWVVKSKICDSIFWCSSTCKELGDHCKGFSLNKTNPDCQLCSLYTDGEVEKKLNEHWWSNDGVAQEKSEPEVPKGDKPMGSLDQSNESFVNLTVYRHVGYDYSDWTEHMLAILHGEQARQRAKYEAASETWMGITGEIKATWAKTLNFMIGTSKEQLQTRKDREAQTPAVEEQ